MTEQERKERLESIRDKVLEEWDKGNVCVMNIEGIMSQPLKTFVQQPLEGMLYDMNRDHATILAFLDDRKWVNDYCLVRILEYYYNKCQELEAKIKEMGGEA